VLSTGVYCKRRIPRKANDGLVIGDLTVHDGVWILSHGLRPGPDQKEDLDQTWPLT
ncbi:hypothetical protein M9458_023157, partial [Cirrhinus mrigala]